MIKSTGYAAKHSFSRLKPWTFEREDARPDEVEIEVLYCGICHSDIHQVHNDWDNTVYPCVPGHEIVGRVRDIGADVTRFAAGDIVGVGCLIDSCGHCGPCRAGDQNYCEGPNGFLLTYNGPMVPTAKSPQKENMYGRDNTFGGYSDCLVVKESFVLKIPGRLKPQQAAPLLCAGVTTYSPLKHWGVKNGSRVGVIGLGGLGHMAVKLARAMGAEVTAFTGTKAKLREAEQMSAHAVFTHDKEAMKKLALHFDFMIDTIPEKHDINPFVAMLKRDSTLCVVGALAPLAPENNMERILHRKSVAGSVIGNLTETQEVLDFCALHNIAPDIEIIDIQDINTAFKKVCENEVRFRYVIDMASLRREQA
jgi:uncharacterized zinc-type alcohol dehydrogenase-like protein